jgi:anti-anti-sigma regulatory factor
MTNGTAPFADVAVEVRLSGEQALLAISGASGASDAARLAALFGAVIASGYSSVVLEVSAIELVDVVLLQVIATAASQLVARGGELMIRGPSAMVTQTLDINWLESQLSLDFPRGARDGVSPGRSAPDGGTPLGDDGELSGGARQQPAYTPMGADRARREPDIGLTYREGASDEVQGG